MRSAPVRASGTQISRPVANQEDRVKSGGMTPTIV
jgi:hypothetical protein